LKEKRHERKRQGEGGEKEAGRRRRAEEE